MSAPQQQQQQQQQQQLRNEDLLALQSYVTAADATCYANVSADTVILDLTHSNLRQRHAEIRFDKHETIDDLRNRIHQKTGTPPSFQRLQFRRGGGSNSSSAAAVPPLFEIPPGRDGDKMLGYYSLAHGMSVHCIDLDPHSGSRGGAYEDTSLVQKYQMTDEEYDKRRGTLREWGRKQKEADPNFSLAKHAREHRELMDAKRLAKEGAPLPPGFEFDASGQVVRSEADEEEASTAATAAAAKEAGKENEPEVDGPDTVDGIAAGMRCEVQPGGRRGAVAFVGEVPELGGGGYWVGVVFDEPVGRTDGTAKSTGKRYFEAPAPNRGGFVRGKNVSVGDYPERDIMDELDSDSEDEL